MELANKNFKIHHFSNAEITASHVCVFCVQQKINSIVFAMFVYSED